MSRLPEVQVPALRGGRTLRWGVLASGAIAGDFAATVLANTDLDIVYVAAPPTSVAARRLSHARSARSSALQKLDRRRHHRSGWLAAS